MQDAKDRRYLSTGRRLRFLSFASGWGSASGSESGCHSLGHAKTSSLDFFFSAPFMVTLIRNCFHRNEMVLYKVRPCLIIANRLERPSFSMYETTRWKLDYSASLQMISTLQRTIHLHQNR